MPFKKRTINRTITRTVIFLMLASFMAGMGLIVPGATAAQAAGVVSNCNSFNGNGTLGQALQQGSAFITITCNSEIHIPNPIEIDQDTLIVGSGWGYLTSDLVHQMFRVHSGKTLSLQNLTLRAGSGNMMGGLIYAVNATVITKNVDLKESNAARGGAIFMDGGHLTMTDSYLINNFATYGGAIFNHFGTVELNNTYVAVNQANTDGGVIYTIGGSLKINGGNYSQNKAKRFGGVIVGHASGETSDLSGPPTPITITNAYFHDNQAMVGGVLQNFPGDYTGEITNIKGSTFQNNSATTNGGAFNLEDAGSVMVINDTFNGNKAGTLGGAFSIFGGALELDNATLSGNTAYKGGDNLYVHTASAYLPAHVIVRNTILANGGTNQNCAGDPLIIPANSKNLQWPGSSCGAAITVADPKLAALANNGGPTMTMALLPGSPAATTGDLTTCTLPRVGNVDQRGNPRVAWNGEPCSIGAYEARAVIYF